VVVVVGGAAAPSVAAGVEEAVVAGVAVADVVGAAVADVAVVVAAAAGGDKGGSNMRTNLISITILSLLAIGVPALAADPTQRKFPRPEEALPALIAAASSGDKGRIDSILGAGSEDMLSSGDPVADKNARDRVIAAAKQGTRLETLPSGDIVIHVGKDDWPLPIPLVKDGNEWRFDSAAGLQEILNRRIGRNEIKAIAVAHVYVEAQREHARLEGDYAQKLRSEPGKRDGLYWEDPSGKHPSPIGPLLAEASAEGYGQQGGDPYHGYVFNILTQQGANAPGGAKSYLKDGKMMAGFALVAYPVEYNSSGVMTFMVGPQGVVFQKNLGDKTADAAKAIAAFDPDESWAPVRIE
jgi:hypothetical protein